MSGLWTVWSDEPDPIDIDLNRGRAVKLVDRLARQGHQDVYAEDEDGNVYEPPDTAEDGR